MAVGKRYLRLTTACGCTRIVEHPFYALPPYRYVMPISRTVVRWDEDPLVFDVTWPKRREFEMYGPHVTIGDDVIFDYREIVEE